jgi:APA family basic amino acid/polyamine antiporter
MGQKSEEHQIGFGPTIALVMGNMIGSGVFFLPASLAAYGGISMFGWALSAFGAISLAIVFAALSRKYPGTTGGPYVYTREGFGHFAAFWVAWGYWISVWCTNAAIAVALIGYLSHFFPTIGEHPVAAISAGLSVIWFLTWVNTRGIKTAGTVQLVTTILKLTPLLMVSIVGIFYINMDYFTPLVRGENTIGGALAATTTLTLFAFLGLECATIPAANVKNPEKTIPRATIWGTLLTALVYMLGSFAVMGIIPPDELMQSKAPFADAATKIWGPWAGNFVAAGVLISTFGALNGWILIQGQIPLAAANDKVFPEIFGRQNSKATPSVGIVLSSILISILLLMNYTKGLVKAFEFMILLTTISVLIPYIFSSATYALTISFEKNPRWLIQLSIALVAFIYSMYAVIGAGYEVVYWGFILLLLGIPIYIWLIKSNPSQPLK